MGQSSLTYAGDDRLQKLLRQAGLSVGLEVLRELVAGIVAAPPGHDAEEWIALVAPQADASLRQQLRALRNEIAGQQPSPFPHGPAPAERLVALRAELARCSLDGFIVPRTDEHQGEYVPAHAERLRWLTGFAGSAGLVVILADRAAIFVDGRYTLQVQDEVDTDVFEVCHLTERPPDEWIASSLPPEGRLGYDSWLMTQAAVTRYGKAIERSGGVLVAVDRNPVDAVWVDQPAVPLAPVVPHDIQYSGQAAADKRTEVGAALAAAKIDAAVLTMPDSIAWLLNIRGGDVAHTPLPLSFAIVDRDGHVDLFIDPRKLAPGLAEHLGNGVAVQPPVAFGPALEQLGRDSAAVRVDPTTAASYVFDRLQTGGAKISNGADPCALPKACKNEVEVNGARRAHERDGLAVTRFLAWFYEIAPKGGLTELAAAEELRRLRFEDELIRDLSFRTISGSGPNGAIVHYSVNAATDREIEPGELYLVDSGAQYLDGTTDITRTVAVGEPTAEMRDRFTRVLKGHIALATARFPVGTTGSQLDPLARHALWQAGIDFDHGTGHGVGSYLGVHEGPQRISKMPSTVPLKPGMIVSNEPGYYKTGAFGIRIENLVTVVACDDVVGAERPLLGFETLTLAPIDLALVELSLLTEADVEWLNAYHDRVRTTLLPQMEGKLARWLKTATRNVRVTKRRRSSPASPAR